MRGAEDRSRAVAKQRGGIERLRRASVGVLRGWRHKASAAARGATYCAVHAARGAVGGPVRELALLAAVFRSLVAAALLAGRASTEVADLGLEAGSDAAEARADHLLPFFEEGEEREVGLPILLGLGEPEHRQRALAVQGALRLSPRRHEILRLEEPGRPRRRGRRERRCCFVHGRGGVGAVWVTVTGAATIGAAAFVSLRPAQERDGVGAVRGEGTGAATGAKARAKILEPKTQAEGKG